MPSVTVVGGGLAGLAATAALADAGYEVNLFESKPYLGGRATSYAVPSAIGTTELIDNCQHILLRCCVNLIDFYRRLGVSDEIEFHRKFYFVEPGGRISVFQAGRLPRPLHFTEAFLDLKFLSLREKIALGKGLLSLMRDARRRRDLESITMKSWLEEKHQPPHVVERFWRQVLVSAINEELDVMAASHAFQVFSLGFLGTSTSYEMGVPRVSLGELYATGRWTRWPNVRIRLRSTVEEVRGPCIRVNGEVVRSDFCVLAVPWGRISGLCHDGREASAIESSPIAGIHLWFDRSITDLPHATLLERNLQWMFNKGGGRHIQLVVSACRPLLDKSRQEIVELALRELCEYFPVAAQATLLKSHIVKEIHATFSARPGLLDRRPGTCTEDPRVFLAGDWTRSGWPSTMEGAVRSGYLAAEAVTRAAGVPAGFLLPDAARF
jgi:zeta-carotene desaturase